MIGASLWLAMSLQAGGLVNGDFSSGLTGWARATYGATPYISFDTEVKHSRNVALKVSAAEPSDTAFGQDVSLHPGSIYHLTGWVRTRGLDSKGCPVYGTIQAQSSKGQILASGHNHSGDTDWTQESIYFVAPSNGQARIAVFLAGWGKGTGTAWFSDLKLETTLADKLPIKFTKEPLVSGRINPMQYGQFIEYLCDLVQSMWAEKLSDGSFEGLSPYKFKFTPETDFKEKPWFPCGQVNRFKVDQDSTTKVSGQASKRIRLGEGSPSEAGIAQAGISVQKDHPCQFSIFVKGTPESGSMNVRLISGDKVLASRDFLTHQVWNKVSATLDPNASSTDATLEVTFRGPGTFWIDNASLMPNETVGGWRKDVVAALKAIKPGVIRLGGSVLDEANLGTFEWTDTIGAPDKRVPFRAWGGLQPTGAGLEEVIQLIQAVGAEPLICLRYEKKTPKDAANEVEYFNGSIRTPMGALRAKNGHREPYGIKYWQIGNERWGEDYWKEVPEFAKAILSVQPDAQLLTSFPSEPLIKGAAPFVQYVSPHQYNVADLNGSKQELEDIRQMILRNAGGRHLKLAITEWNTTAGDAGLPRAMLWNLDNALACSRYQNLLHREADLVEIANRSNLTNSFCSGIIQTDRTSLYLTPTYYAQYLYSNLAGTRPLKIDSAMPSDIAPDTSATLSDDGKWLTVFFVNSSENTIERSLDFSAFGKQGQTAEVWTLGDTQHAGEPDAVNSFLEPKRIIPVKSRFEAKKPQFTYAFPALTLTVMRWRVSN